MELTVKDVYEMLLRSNLLSAAEAKRMFERRRAEARDRVNDPGQFTSWMVANQYVTEYQVSLLSRGHTDCFHLNEYQILDRIGKGHVAGVYRARHRLGQIVAIKVLPPSKAKHPDLLARFLRESKLATRLRHPNVVRGYQMGVSGDLHYLVMEYLQGQTLQEVLRARERLPAMEAARLIHQALLGLQYLHEQELIHRDLKPANLMLVPTPEPSSTFGCTVKILDVGMGRSALDVAPGGENVGLTREGILLGTPDYWAPEQARDPRAADIRSDVYSLGCVFYHLLTGQPPFPDTDLISQMIRHATETPQPLRDFDPTLPDGLEQILGWMMAKDPNQRYPTPERAAKAIEMFLVAAGIEINQPTPDPKLESYLHWLDQEEKKEHQPTMPSVPVEKSKLNPAKRKVVRDDKPSQKKSTPLSVSSQRDSPAEVQVELVKLDPPLRGGGLTRRELFAFIFGVVSGLTAYAAGRGLAAWFGSAKLDQNRSVQP